MTVHQFTPPPPGGENLIDALQPKVLHLHFWHFIFNQYSSAPVDFGDTTPAVPSTQSPQGVKILLMHALHYTYTFEIYIYILSVQVIYWLLLILVTLHPQAHGGYLKMLLMHHRNVCQMDPNMQGMLPRATLFIPHVVLKQKMFIHQLELHCQRAIHNAKAAKHMGPVKNIINGNGLAMCGLARIFQGWKEACQGMPPGWFSEHFYLF